MRIGNAVKCILRRFWEQVVRPSSHEIKGAAAACLIAAGLVYLVFIVLSAGGPLLPALVELVGMAAAGLLLLFLGQGIAWVIGLLAKIPWDYRWSLFGSAALLAMPLMGFNGPGAVAVIAALITAASLMGAGLAAFGKDWRDLPVNRRVAAVIKTVLGTALLAGALVWYFWTGSPAAAIPNAAKSSGAPVARVTLPDPSQPGDFPVASLTYGSGKDLHRPEFGEQAAIITQPVNGEKLLSKSWEGLTGDLRSLWWGFGPRELPLNGRVWYPEGQGPFPLALIVHGNHAMSDFSDGGYAYLGELMASRGFIFVSIDENFLNGGAVNLFDSFRGENDARAWMMLEHLRQWEAWNNDPESPFYKKVDMENIALLGHSRGGEAAAVAAVFNRLPCYPDAAEMVFDYGFNIRAVAAIAPVDGQYEPSLKPAKLTDTNYFVLHGANDSDVTSFDGVNFYERVRFTPGSSWFKSALYIYRANHGQFNSSWGDSDIGPFRGGFLQRAALLPAEAQEKIARVYLSAFLEAALHGQSGYLPLFADARAAGDGWLPDTVYINRFDTAADRIVAGYEEDVDLSSTTLAGGRITAEGFNHWREQNIHTKWSEAQTNAGVYLAWNEDGQGVYTISLPASGLDLSAGDALIFSLADANQDPKPGKNAPSETDQNAAGAARQPIDLTVVLEDAQGNTASLPVSTFMPVQPQIKTQIYKHALFEKNKPSEPVLQGYVMPLASFAAENSDFNPAALRSIRFVFDRTPRGSVILDGIGFRGL